MRDEDGKPRRAGRAGRDLRARRAGLGRVPRAREPRSARDGWFPTRDGGFLDEEGYLFLEGRIDDVIVRGGENLSPGEIEDVLLEHPSVADCAVVGVPDEQWGEAVAAVIVPREGAAARRRRAARVGARAAALVARAGARSSSATSCPTTRPASSCAARCGPSSPEARATRRRARRPLADAVARRSALARSRDRALLAARRRARRSSIDLGGRRAACAEVAAAAATLAPRALPDRRPRARRAARPPGRVSRPRCDVLVERRGRARARARRPPSAAPLAAAALVQMLRAGERSTSTSAWSPSRSPTRRSRRGPSSRPGSPRAAAPRLRERRRSARPCARGARARACALTLDRPRKRNAFSVGDARRASSRRSPSRSRRLDRARSSSTARARPSASGGDLDEFGTLPRSGDGARGAHDAQPRAAARALRSASARGRARRLRRRRHRAPRVRRRVRAREDACFQLPELAMGLVPGAGGTVSLPRRIGRQRTAWLALSGRRIDAATALALGARRRDRGLARTRPAERHPMSGARERVAGSESRHMIQRTRDPPIPARPGSHCPCAIATSSTAPSRRPGSSISRRPSSSSTSSRPTTSCASTSRSRAASARGASRAGSVPGGWVLTRYDDVARGAAQPEDFSSQIGPSTRCGPGSPRRSTRRAHTGYRRILNPVVHGRGDGEARAAPRAVRGASCVETDAGEGRVRLRGRVRRSVPDRDLLRAGRASRPPTTPQIMDWKNTLMHANDGHSRGRELALARAARARPRSGRRPASARRSTVFQIARGRPRRSTATSALYSTSAAGSPADDLVTKLLAAKLRGRAAAHPGGARGHAVPALHGRARHRGLGARA